MLEEMHLSAQIYPKELELLHKKTSPTESQTCFMFVLADTAKAVAEKGQAAIILLRLHAS